MISPLIRFSERKMSDDKNDAESIMETPKNAATTVLTIVSEKSEREKKKRNCKQLKRPHVHTPTCSLSIFSRAQNDSDFLRDYLMKIMTM